MEHQPQTSKKSIFRRGPKWWPSALFWGVIAVIILTGLFFWRKYQLKDNKQPKEEEKKTICTPKGNGCLTDDGQVFIQTGEGLQIESQNYGSLLASTPYVNESDIKNIPEVYSTKTDSPWGEHTGIDFQAKSDLIPVQAATEGIITMLETKKEEGLIGWSASFCITHYPYLVCYKLETFNPTDAVGSKQKENIFIKNGDKVKTGDLLAKLVYSGQGGFIDFGIVDATGERVCPEPYFTPEAKESVLKLLHKSHPSWPICY